MLEFLERRFKSAYLNLLESEIKRLREENRQLMNSILASHGMGQIEGPRSNKPMMPLKRPDWLAFKRKMERESMRPAPRQEKPDVAS